MALPRSTPGSLRRDLLEIAHDTVLGSTGPVVGVRDVVQESWRRAVRLHLDPDRPVVRLGFDELDLREYRAAHPLAFALPTIQRLLVRHTVDAGLIVAVGDRAGRLLWIDGDTDLKRKAEAMMFVEGADWSEAAVGTSAPGTALALDQSMQIRGAEHFARIVHPWSCTAVPVHDPDSGAILGVIDITGGQDAVAPATQPLLEAAVAAVEAELRIHRLDERGRTRRGPQRSQPQATPLLSVLGRDRGLLEAGGQSVELGPRHTEILTLLAWHSEGVSAEHLANLLYERDDAVVTLRAEMVRLRRVVEVLDPTLVPLSRPYRLARRLDLDANRVLAFLDRGAHRVALGAYTGRVLPTSATAAIRDIRDGVSSRLRDALMSDASVDTLLDYARTDDAAYDVGVWRECLRLLPPRSPKRASVVARLERLEADLTVRNGVQPSLS